MKLSFEQKGSIIHVDLPHTATDNFVSLVKLEFDKIMEYDSEVVAESTFGGFSLSSNNLLNPSEYEILRYDGKRPSHIISKGQELSWQMEFPEKGLYTVAVSAHNPTNKDLRISIQIGNQSINGLLKPNGLMVVEPNENNYAEEFTDIHIGQIDINSASKLKVSFRSSNEQPLWLNRIWIKKI